jgi:hypothetical protein
MGTMTVAILISIVQWDGLSPLGTALEVDMGNVGTGINDVNVNTLTTA